MMMTEAEKRPYITGFCAVGACEGSQLRSPSGVLFTPCKGTYWFYPRGRAQEVVCQHSCHAAFAQIRALIADLPPVDGILPITLPSTVEETAIPSPVATPAQSPDSVALSPSTVPTSGLADPTVTYGTQDPPSHLRAQLLDFRPQFAPTPSGRAARGQLEDQVRKEICKAYAAGADMLAMVGITPKAVADSINPEKPPSHGAVYAIFKRWEKNGWVELAEKPFRLVKITDLGQRNLIR